ncbi:MAG: DNA polymerase III subunit alpha [Fusobacteriaceae bacterium]
MNKNFTHLHLHSEYSLLDGVGKIDEYLDCCLKLGMKSMALTDHGNMFGAVEFYKKAFKKGIKPIIGMETYIVQDRFSKERDDENLDRRNYHLVLLAKDENGYKNLMKLSSLGYTEGFYYRPRIDKKILKEHSDGIVALTACMNGEIPYAILHNSSQTVVDNLVKEYLDIFGRENFYLEIQSNGIKEQKNLNEKLLTLGKKYNINLVVTNDVHYIHKGDHELQDIAICIQTGAKVSDEKRMKIETQELYFKSREQMNDISLFFSSDYILENDEVSLKNELEKALNNTFNISEFCDLDIKFGEFKFPKYPIPKEYGSIESFLRDKVFDGLSLRYPEGYSEEITKRADYELSTINSMGYAEYFIVVWDFIKYAREKNIPIGPGRGSAAGSLVSYALKITDLDPLEYGLIFERFLNPERISMPDIDIDICQERRQEVIAYVTEKYGNDRVAQIITFGRMKARSAVRDIGRVMGTSLSKIDKLAKLLIQDSIKSSISSVPEVAEIYNSDPEMQKILDFAVRLENSVRHASIHAAGIVITENPLTDYVPLYSDSRGENISTQYQMKELEDLGLLKMDFLGLRNLTILERAIQFVKTNHNISITLNEIPLNNSRVYKMLSSGDSSGVFQLESQGIRNLMKRLKPERFNDIIALLALYRPGPLGSGMVDNFINCKNGIEKIRYPDSTLKDVLQETYGVILYQEQVMKIAQIMADYTLAEADNLRRAMGKKDFELMENNRLMFIERAQKKGYSQEKAEEIFFLIDKFAGYGFNKSHSAAYALIAYWTAYFKNNYPSEYYAAVISTHEDIDDIGFYIEDARAHGIKLLAPDINSPSSTFDVVDGKIRLAIPGVKNIGAGFTEKLIEDRKQNGEYNSYEDFVIRGKRFGLTKKILYSLIASGSLDSLSGNRKQKMESLEKVLDYGERVNREDEIQQMNLFGEAKTIFQRFHLPEISDFSIDETIGLEKENLGFYLSAHPLDNYRSLITILKTPSISLLLNEKDVHGVKTCGIIKGIKKIVTKKDGKIMATFFLEDFSGKISVTLFPRTYEECFHFLEEGASVFIEGSLQTDYFNNQETQKLLVKSITPLNFLDENPKLRCFILISEDDRDKFNKLKTILENHPGKNPVSFAIKKDGEKTVKNSKFNISISSKFIHDIVELMGIQQIVIK